jgi:hypothetical protein
MILVKTQEIMGTQIVTMINKNRMIIIIKIIIIIITVWEIIIEKYFNQII